MNACSCGNKGAEGAESDLKTHIQLLVPLSPEAAYLAKGYTIVGRDEYMLTVRKSLYQVPPELSNTK